MNIILAIITSLTFGCLISIYIIYKEIKKQKIYLETLIQVGSSQLQALKLHNEAAIANLWKIRQEIYNWQCLWASEEEYKAADAAKKMIHNIEYLISALEEINENNETTNGSGI